MPEEGVPSSTSRPPSSPPGPRGAGGIEELRERTLADFSRPEVLPEPEELERLLVVE